MTVIRPRAMRGGHRDRAGAHAWDVDLAVTTVDRFERGGRSRGGDERRAECDRSDEAAHARQISRDQRCREIARSGRELVALGRGIRTPPMLVAAAG